MMLLLSVPLCFVVLALSPLSSFFFFFFNDPATTEIYPLPLHAALPISDAAVFGVQAPPVAIWRFVEAADTFDRSEEHTSELQSLAYLVCRLLLEKKKKKNYKPLPRTRPRQPAESPSILRAAEHCIHYSI